MSSQEMAIPPLIMQTAISMHREDAERITARAKGKQLEGVTTDAELALRAYMNEMNNVEMFYQDRAMAQSISLAILRDQCVLQDLHAVEQQVADDKVLALRISGGRKGLQPETAPQEQTEELWEDEEMLAKARAIYVGTLGEDNDPLVEHGENTLGTEPESSARAAARASYCVQSRRNCIACGETKDFVDVARVPCNHEYCRACLAELFTLSVKDETLFPPRCDGQEIPLARVRFFLPVNIAKQYESRYTELSSKNRTYCYDASCNAFIPQASIENDIGRCPQCNIQTCTICKGASHAGDCPSDAGLQSLIDTATAEGWQRCNSCKRFVELEHGCNHIT